jgi:hypothetical protein
MNKVIKFLWSKWKPLSTVNKLLIGGTVSLATGLWTSGWLILIGFACLLIAGSIDVGLISIYKEWRKDYDAFEENSKR